jgi:hypothetical protein
MTSTSTATLGYGIRIDPDVFTAKTGYNQERYEDGYLDEKKYPLLHIAYEGIASLNVYVRPNHWIFIKPGLSRIHSGVSGKSMNAPVNTDDLDFDELNASLLQLKDWCKEFGHEDVNPEWNMTLWVN